MNAARPDPPKFNFWRTFVLPALLVFLIPVFSWWFFQHVQAHFDAQVLASIEKSIAADKEATEEQRAKARDFYRAHPASELVASDEPRGVKLRASLDSNLVLYYSIFRWMIRLAATSVLMSLGVFVLGGLGAWWALRSQAGLLHSLSIGWIVLRVVATVQVLVQATLTVALSYWVTAFWFQFYAMKLIVLAAVMALGASFAVIAAIFRKINDEFVIEGILLDRATAAPLWADLERICQRVGTPVPDRVVAGIDNNFFVTEHPVTIGGKVQEGRTLFVSLSLLKVMQGAQADAVMAHEMAHFSGEDTVFSKQISPSLNRFEIYLQALHEGGLSRPVFHFMCCFRGLFELALGRRRREREFRADRIAAECTSPEDMAGALVKVAAYSEYRGKVEQELFAKEQVLETLDISQRIATGFPQFAAALVAEDKLKEAATAHPFDSHPPLEQRLAAVGVQLSREATDAVLQRAPDGRWFNNIPAAAELEREQWAAYEGKFREVHERVLAYRYRPDTEAERAVVLKHFPGVTLEGKKGGTLIIDHAQVHYSEWADAIRFCEVTKCIGEESALGHPQVRIEFHREKTEKRTLPLDAFKVETAVVIDAFNQYYGRHQAMLAYAKEKEAETAKPAAT